jgi:phage repressor protein C with HTH and peptisase S24 domain
MLTEYFDRDGFSVRLRELQGGLSDRAFAARIGISPTSLYNYLNGQTPGVDKVVGIAGACGVSIAWLITGIGDRSPDAAAGSANGMTPVPLLDLRASAGSGAAGGAGEPVDVFPMPEQLLRSTGVRADKARVLTVIGDSMEPTLSSGDLLLVDTSVRTVKGEALYVLVREDELFVKRAQKRLNGSVLISSDNPRYHPEEFSESDAVRLRVAGRVVWFGRSI